MRQACPGSGEDPELDPKRHELTDDDRKLLKDMKIIGKKAGYAPIKFLAVPLDQAERVASVLISSGITDFDAEEEEDLAVGRLAYFYFHTEDDTRVAAEIISKRFAKQIAAGRGGWERWRTQRHVLDLHDHGLPKRKTLLSGKQAGQWGERSYDSDQVHDLLDECRPTITKGGKGFGEPIPAENLPNILNNLDGMDAVVGDNDEIYLGVVVFLLSHGSDVPEKYRRHAEHIAERILGDEQRMLQWKDPVAARTPSRRNYRSFRLRSIWTLTNSVFAEQLVTELTFSIMACLRLYKLVFNCLVHGP